MQREDLDAVVTTGYGTNSYFGWRQKYYGDYLSCQRCTFSGSVSHGQWLDIGGQDSKVIRLNEDGNSKEFCYE